METDREFIQRIREWFPGLIDMNGNDVEKLLKLHDHKEELLDQAREELIQRTKQPISPGSESFTLPKTTEDLIHRINHALGGKEESPLVKTMAPGLWKER